MFDRIEVAMLRLIRRDVRLFIEIIRESGPVVRSLNISNAYNFGHRSRYLSETGL